MKFIDACIKYKRFFAAGLVGLMIIGMTAGASAQFAPADNPEMNVKKDFTDESENKKLNKLLESYYKYYDAGDTDNLQKIAYPISDSEISYIKMMSAYIDSTDITAVYSKQGLDDSLMVSVCIETTFTGQSTKAPGLDFFYVSYDKDKKLYIDNLYSTFNVQNSENEMDPSITALISEYERQDDVAALQSKQQKKYEAAIESDPTLDTLMTTTFPAVTSTWAVNYQTSLAQKKAEDKAAADKAAQDAADAAKAAEDQKAQEAAASERQQAMDNATQLITAGKVNVRESAGEDASVLGQLDCGMTVSKFSDEGDWSKIDFYGKDGYVKTQYLTSTTSTDSREVTLTSTINVRYEMDENATKLTVASAGTTIKVDADYANGWSKVEVDGQAGFAKTEVLK